MYLFSLGLSNLTTLQPSSQLWASGIRVAYRTTETVRERERERLRERDREREI